MKTEGTLLKMEAQQEDVVNYTLPVGNSKIYMNALIGSEISIKFKDEIYCIGCGAKTKKSYGQGYCYKCFITRPENEECILRPELCKAHEGIARDMEWARQHCLQEHFVYLAVSSGLKVGVTRSSQIPTRWIDQGAWKAIKLAQTPYRQLAGQIEVKLKEHLSDRTSWQRMLKNQVDTSIDLVEEKQYAYEILDDELKPYVIEDDTITEISYPVNNYPEKVKSINFDKTALASGVLKGIKGQYFIFDTGYVINIRRHNGYLVEISHK